MTKKDLSQPIYDVKTIHNVMIPMSDGVSLAADLIMPDGEPPFPAIIEYIPYRKDDLSAAGAATHHYFAQRGFVGVRLDVRGTGSSEGVALNEYIPQEQKDACEAIEWLSKQSWCNGNIGMWGTSYGGFNAIQTAMHNPPALKAIVPHAATDDRYRDDVHYFGGTMMGLDLLIYPLWMITMNVLPPHPTNSGAKWASIWKERLEDTPPWIMEWMRHQTEDAYWHQASLKTDYGAIKCPVYQIGGWVDGYTNATMRMAEHLKVPNKALVGPWNHGRPSYGYPGPNIDYLHEMTRWWGHWLRGDDTGIMDEPRMAVYIQEGTTPHPFLQHMPGSWRFYDKWPPDGIKEKTYYLGSQHALREEPEVGGEEDAFEYKATVGLSGGFWCPISPPYGMARDQRVDEIHSLVYTSPPIEEPVELLGTPKALLHVSSSAEVAFFVVKLSDVSPDGTSTLVSRGILNATRRTSFSDPEPLVPDEVYELEIPLKVASWTFKKGHHLRVAISGSDFPTMWPSPFPATNKVLRGSVCPSRIILPIVEEVVASSGKVDFQLPEALPTMAHMRGETPTWQISQDIVSGITTVTLTSSGSTQPLDRSHTLTSDTYTEMAASDENPGQTTIKGTSKCSYILPSSRTDVIGRAAIRSTTTDIHVDVELRVDIDDEPFFRKKWVESFPRQLL